MAEPINEFKEKKVDYSSDDEGLDENEPGNEDEKIGILPISGEKKADKIYVGRKLDTIINKGCVGTSTKSYSVFTITGKELSKIRGTWWNRPLDDVHVNNIYNSLLKDPDSFGVVELIQDRNGKTVVAGGNHRMAALRMVLAKKPDYDITFLATLRQVYEISSDEAYEMSKKMNLVKEFKEDDSPIAVVIETIKLCESKWGKCIRETKSRPYILKSELKATLDHVKVLIGKLKLSRDGLFEILDDINTEYTSKSKNKVKDGCKGSTEKMYEKAYNAGFFLGMIDDLKTVLLKTLNTMLRERNENKA